MGFRTLASILAAVAIWAIASIVAPPVLALTQIQLSDLSYSECPPAYAEGMVTSWGATTPASCYLITGKAKNTSGKTVYDADVYGRVYDANGEPVMQNRTRVGAIAEVPPGISDFEVRITVPTNQPTPLKLEQFKASGFEKAVRPVLDEEDLEELD